MSIEFKLTEKEYFLLVNHPELVKRAEELGYQGVTLFTGTKFDDSEKEFIKEAGKVVVLVEYNADQKDECGWWSYSHIEDTESTLVIIDLTGNEIEEGKHIDSFQEAIEHFPRVEGLEKWLRQDALINETDYTGRCGNCQSYLGADDKYCRYCGTERGKGEFKPFKNVACILYGPPIKRKYKCTACGHIWITSQPGGDDSKYCPLCGKKTLNLLEDKEIEMIYKKHLAGIEAEKLGKNAAELGKNAVFLAAGLGVVAGDAAKKAANRIGDVAKKNIAAQKKVQKESGDDKKENKKKNKLDDQLKAAVTEYNAAYTNLNDHGTKLFNQRERSLDLLDNVEHLINSIANHPKEFDADIAEIQVNKKEFRDVCDFAKKELEAAQKSAVGVGAGVAGGMAVASLAPSAAMWIATTFGTASTGTAISALSGAAATNAALAWLGGGALAAGGGGMVAGNAFLALAGPVGWSIAGATLLTSIVLFANKKIKLDKEKKEEIESVLKNTEQLKETDAKLAAILKKTEQIRNGLSEQYTSGMSCFGKNFMELSEDAQTTLGTIVNNAKALAASLGEGV